MKMDIAAVTPVHAWAAASDFPDDVQFSEMWVHQATKSIRSSHGPSTIQPQEGGGHDGLHSGFGARLRGL